MILDAWNSGHKALPEEWERNECQVSIAEMSFGVLGITLGKWEEKKGGREWNWESMVDLCVAH